MAVGQSHKRIEISLPLSSYALVQEAAARRGLSVRSYIASCAYDAALQDIREHMSMNNVKTAYSTNPCTGFPVKRARILPLAHGLKTPERALAMAKHERLSS